ncbi:MAG: Eco57I restriction-modification methylase domain-containing protein [Actinobacteria bacterium]|nr:Eco57I restriction-modification methylase domain-containing protein [Actinomycetota bacterium]MBI3687701.1 Eco57I restriction-modification methylase domain-containing protein [Actinomycetota bacterium]
MAVSAADRQRDALRLRERAEARRVRCLAGLNDVDQAKFGQFFTPEAAAALIAALPRLPLSGRLRVLDPGAGTGALAAALAARVLGECLEIDLEIVAVEIDAAVAKALAETLADITQTFDRYGLRVTTGVVVGDFIDLSTGLLDRHPSVDEPFDIVIMNPPYRKLASSSAQRKALLQQGVECPNLYAAFLALGTVALSSDGQLVAITPRSFANGPYFAQFRRFMLDMVALDHIHIFESRSTVFSETGVLQENIIFAATRGRKGEDVVLTVSHGHKDPASVRVVPYSAVVNSGDVHRFIRIPAGDDDTTIAELMTSMPASCSDLGVQVSTGRVVDFRSRTSLVPADRDRAVPLVYPGNLRSGVVEWPRDIRKAQGFLVTEPADEKLLLPPGNYVLVKRFSAKEERRRVVAAVWLAEQSADPVAFENHVNVLHVRGAGLDLPLALGLSYWLNSSVVDTYFRTFSGHTQVNAGDLRTLRFPSVAQLRALGADRSVLLPDQAELDAIVNKVVTARGIAA